MRCVLVGNYGVGNIGDEALKEYFLSEFPDIQWTVVSGAPRHAHEVPRLPLGIRSFFAPWVAGRLVHCSLRGEGGSSRSSVGWWRTLREIQHADALVFGGGSLFTDIESVWACIIWRAYALVARVFGTPIVLAFQGAGPWKTALGRRLARKTFEEASFVSVRDEESFARLQEFGLKQSPVVTFDPAFAHFAAHPRSVSAERKLLLIPRSNSNEVFFAEVQKKLSHPWNDIRILLMQPDAAERRVGERVRRLCGEATIIEPTAVAAFLDEISTASEVLSQRYHGALAAFAMSIPVRAVPQSPGDKMDAFNRLVLQAGSKEALLHAIDVGAAALRKALVA